jgi:hypothetical protein
MILTIALAYGGHDEIVDAVRALLAEQADLGLGASRDNSPGLAGIAQTIGIT